MGQSNYRTGVRIRRPFDAVPFNFGSRDPKTDRRVLGDVSTNP